MNRESYAFDWTEFRIQKDVIGYKVFFSLLSKQTMTTADGFTDSFPW